MICDIIELNASQTCICANRVLVHEDVHDKFIEKVATLMKEQLKLGSGFEASTSQGPLINKSAVEKVKHLSSGFILYN